MVDSTNLPNVDINQIATDLNNKMDRDGVNATCPMVISRERKSDGGIVEIWSDGFCVQTGYVKRGGYINFNIPFIDTNYLIISAQNSKGSSTPQYYNTYYFENKETGRAYYVAGQEESPTIAWRAEGYIR